MTNTAIEKAIKLWGSQKRFAEHIGKAQSTVSDWLTGKKRISPENVVIIVEATNGAVQAHELRPDLPKVFPPPAEHGHVS
ncbi:helix-turn-helix domain-containing protein [Xenorhabdus bovienii]|uniref:transcriptional regulator n=1 Tax=Xenorhabdus bovienii TaxID=40576 RepID=UPI00237C707B|nr:helix-turn-helix domain-containing protein [Xenorhabdus bovienii]MDE1489029.1 helix-turn-helix domain-containing protein [Xenorhabdus bovienii]MDE9475076.1 helix-turn-helix domain-containing protein [Xenorhabdus bovienii]MDE9479795.1 helix-turn-helix domain-containing protein [Xenorhabdus bovienii]MDE9532701.1 helix-turn-helix domain-containing protein [Xenorhabdus bovienii]MDE9537072.1 helix-turn-helix domain-containing protein [Xenorhabdus bovienii]